MRPPLLLFAAVVGLLAARPCVAAPRERVLLDVAADCSAIDRAQLARLLDVEQHDPSSVLHGARVSVSCDAEGVTLRVGPAPGGAWRSRAFATADVSGEIGARVLSLAAIELLKSEPAAAPVEATPGAEPAPASPPPPSKPAAVVPPTVRMTLQGSLRSFAAKQTLAGGGLAVDYLRLRGFGFRLSFDVGVARRRYDIGSARLQLTTLSAQAGYLALHDAWMARAFVGYRLGAARISGQTEGGSVAPVGTVAGPCGGPLLSGGLGLRSRAWVAELSAEAGLVSFPIRGTVEGHDPIALDHYWLGLSLGVGALL